MRKVIEEASADYHRHSIRMAGHDYAQGGVYFVTVCAKDRKCVFGEVKGGIFIPNDAGQIARKCWLQIPEHYQNVRLHEFVVMPNHIHGIIELVGANYYSPDDTGQIIFRANNNSPLRACGTSGTLGAIVRGFKIGTVKMISGPSLWQRNYYEHIIRSSDDYHRIADYVVTNPLRWVEDCYHPQNI